MHNLIRQIFLAFLLFIVIAMPVRAADKLTLYTTEIAGQTMIDDAEPGTAIEIVREAAKRAGIEIDVRFVPWSRAVNSVKGSADAVIVPFSRTPARERQFTWIGKLYPVRFGFVSFDTAIDDKMTAKKLTRVGVWRGTSMEEELRRNGFQNLVSVSNDRALVQMLIKGRIDAWYCSLVEAAYKFRGIKEINQAKIRFGQAVREEAVWIAGGRDMPDKIVIALRDALAAMRQAGVIRSIIARYGFKGTS